MTTWSRRQRPPLGAPLPEASVRSGPDRPRSRPSVAPARWQRPPSRPERPAGHGRTADLHGLRARGPRPGMQVWYLDAQGHTEVPPGRRSRHPARMDGALRSRPTVRPSGTPSYGGMGMAERVRITYATMSADNPKLHADYDEGMRTAKSWLGQKHQFYVNGEAREGEGYDEERSPIDRDIVIGYFARATRQDAKDAIEAARKFFPKWSGTPWDERVKTMRQAADVISDRAYELAALMAMEVGKSRLEAIGD